MEQKYENYKPAKKEIYDELISGFKNKSIEYFKAFVSPAISAGAVSAVASMHAIPSYFRWLRARVENDAEQPGVGSFISTCTGMLTGITISTIGSELIYISVLKSDYPEIALLPIATNVLSGLYELGRGSYKNAEKRLIKKRKAENNDCLEKRLNK